MPSGAGMMSARPFAILSIFIVSGIEELAIPIKLEDIITRIMVLCRCSGGLVKFDYR